MGLAFQDKEFINTRAVCQERASSTDEEARGQNSLYTKTPFKARIYCTYCTIWQDYSTTYVRPGHGAPQVHRDYDVSLCVGVRE